MIIIDCNMNIIFTMMKIIQFINICLIKIPIIMKKTPILLTIDDFCIYLKKIIKKLK